MYAQSRSRRAWRATHPLQLLVLLAAGGCGDQVMSGQPVAIDAGRLRSILTLAASADLDADGNFPLIAPGVFEGRALIDADQAVVLASAYLATFAPYHLGYLERLHGQPIELSKLQIGRVYFAETPHRNIPRGELRPLENALGPYFVVHFLQRGVPAVAVSVSAFATDVRVEDNRPVIPRGHGEDFSLAGLPFGQPTTPEAAAVGAARKTGKLVAGPPRLIKPIWGAPELSVWDVPLESSVRLTLQADPDGRVAVSDVYVGQDGGVYAPLRETSNPAFTRTFYDQTGERISITTRILSDDAPALEKIMSNQEGR